MANIRQQASFWSGPGGHDSRIMEWETMYPFCPLHFSCKFTLEICNVVCYLHNVVYIILPWNACKLNLIKNEKQSYLQSLSQCCGCIVHTFTPTLQNCSIEGRRKGDELYHRTSRIQYSQDGMLLIVPPTFEGETRSLDKALKYVYIGTYMHSITCSY